MNTSQHNSSNSTHPSFFELDRAALGSPASSETELHIERCGRCQEHIEDVTQREPLPQWVLDLDRHTEEKTISSWWKSGWSMPIWVTSFGAAAALAVTVMVVMPGPQNVEDSGTSKSYVGAKGTPSVGVYVRRENRTFLHSTGDPLQAGDRIRLQVAPNGYSQIFVFSRSGSGELTLLFQGPLDPDGNHLLPKAWEVDASGTEETLVVALGEQTMNAERARQSVQDRGAQRKMRKLGRVRGSNDLWVRTLVLPKQTP